MTNKLYKRVVVSYLVIFMIPILTGLFAYQQAALNAERQTSQLVNAMLERVSEAMDYALDDVEALTLTLSMNSEVTKLISSEPLERDASIYYRMYNARQALADNDRPVDNLLDVMLYCDNSGVLVTSSRIFLSLDRFYDGFFKYGELTQDEWKALMLDDQSYVRYFPARNIMVRTGAENANVHHYDAILFTRTVRTNLGIGKLIANVPLDALDGLQDALFRVYGGCVIMYDENGREVAALGNADAAVHARMAEFDQRDAAGHDLVQTQDGSMLLASVQSDSGWHYVAALQASEVYGDLNVLKLTVWGMVAVEVLLLVVLAVVFTRRSVKPVKGLIELVSDADAVAHGGAADEYDYLRKMIMLMKQNYQSASSRLDAQTSLLRRQLIQSRLRGDTPEAALRESFERAQLRYPEDDAALALLLVEDAGGSEEEASENLTRLVLSEQFKSLAGENILYSRLDDDRYVIVFFDGNDAAAQEELLSSLVAATAEAGCPQPVISLCPPDAEHTLAQRYTRADLRIHRWDAEPGVIDRIDASTELRAIGVHYSVKVEERVIRCIKAGNPSELKAALDKLVRQNADNVHDCPEVAAILTSAFRLTCARAQREAQFTPGAGERDAVNVDPESAICVGAPLEDFYAWCMRAAEQIEHQRRASGSCRTIEPVCEYLRQNFADKQLSLSCVASRFGFSETYFSRLFKAQTGEAYSEYLERLRIGHARTLLEQGESVDSTASRTGYNSVTVFRAAFKRICGVTPSEYKQQASRGSDAVDV